MVSRDKNIEFKMVVNSGWRSGHNALFRHSVHSEGSAGKIHVQYNSKSQRCRSQQMKKYGSHPDIIL